MSRILEDLVAGIAVPGESLSASLTINGSPDVYTLLEERGDGGQGTLYKAQKEDGQVVAVKVLHRKPDVQERERFVSWQKLDDVSGVTHLLAHGSSNLALRNYAVVSDYVDGVTLEQLRARHPLSEEVVHEILLQSATVLGDIHAREVLHRDVKPSNIMIDHSGSVSITDFGASRSADVKTLTGTVAMGTLLYVAPEQYQGKPTPASDLHSLGLTMYYLMKGEHPPMMASLDYPRSLYFEDFAGDYSLQLISVVKKMCEHDAAKRYENARAVLDDLAGNTLVVQQSSDVISNLETRVRERRNLAIVSVGATLVGPLVAYLGYLQLEDVTGYFAPLGLPTLLLGSTMALTAVSAYGAFGHQYWGLRRKLKDAKERLQLEATSILETSSAVLVPEIVDERVVAVREEIKSLEKQIVDFPYYESVLATGFLPFIFLINGITGDFYGANGTNELIGRIKASYTTWKAKKRLPKAKTELEILVEQDPEVKNLLIQKVNMDNPNPWWGDVILHFYSIMATGAAAYTVYAGRSLRQALVNTGIAAGIYVAEKAFLEYLKRKNREAIDDKITALRQISETTSLEQLTTERDQVQLEIRKQAANCIGSTSIVTLLFGTFAVANSLGYTTPISSVSAITAAVGMPIIQAGRYYVSTRTDRKRRRELGHQIEVLQQRQPQKEPYLLVEWQERAEPKATYMQASIEANRVYQRLPTCAEQMSLLIARLEGTLKEEDQQTFANMMNGPPEWTSEAIRVVEKTGNIFRRGRRYLEVYPTFTSAYLSYRDSTLEQISTSLTPLEIDITGVGSGKRMDGVFTRQLLPYFFSREYGSLPTAVRQEGRITIPELGKIWLVYRNRYSFGLASPTDSFAYRGIRERRI